MALILGTAKNYRFLQNVLPATSVTFISTAMELMSKSFEVSLFVFFRLWNGVITAMFVEGTFNRLWISIISILFKRQSKR